MSHPEPMQLRFEKALNTSLTPITTLMYAEACAFGRHQLILLFILSKAQREDAQLIKNQE